MHCQGTLTTPYLPWQAGSSFSFAIVQPFTCEPLAIDTDSWLAPLRQLPLLWFHLPLPKTFAVSWLTLFALGVAAPFHPTSYILDPTTPDQRVPTGIFWKSAPPPPPPPFASQSRVVMSLDDWDGAVPTTHANATQNNASARLRAGSSLADASKAVGRRARLNTRQHSLLLGVKGASATALAPLGGLSNEEAVSPFP